MAPQAAGPALLPREPRRRGGVLVRPWRAGDASALAGAVAASRAHLRPWLAWAAEVRTVAEVRAQIAERDAAWLAGGDAVYGIFVAGAVAGGCGLHRRLGPDGLEIGYWLGVAHTGRGVMTAAAGLLTDMAFSLPEIQVVEIHHDRANESSAGVPRRLGFELAGELERKPQAPGEVGVECQWRMTRARWLDGQRPGARPRAGHSGPNASAVS